jgi:hypothetical protein
MSSTDTRYVFDRELTRLDDPNLINPSPVM